MTYSNQLPAPYGTCKEKPKYDSIWSIDGQKLKYSKSGCQEALYENEVKKSCGCIAAIFPVLGARYANLTPCGINLTIDRWVCMENAFYLNDTVCVDLCHIMSYQKQATTHPWIKLDETLAFYNRYIGGKLYKHRFNITDSVHSKRERLYNLIKDNFARVTINYNLREIIVFKEVPQFSFTSFIGQLGGIPNLYSGISFIIIIELADFLISFCCRSKWLKSTKIVAEA